MNTLTRVSQCSPLSDYLASQAEIDAAVLRVLAGGRYILGPEVSSFEREFADYLGASYAVGVGNGTDALQIAMRACGVGVGDTVIVPTHTAVATAAAVSMIGAKPLFVDVDPVTYHFDENDVCSILSAGRVRVKALICVHLYGGMADLRSVIPLAREVGCYVIEDCAQAHGALANGRMAGTVGDISAFSFYPTKNLGALGDAGCIVTSRPDLYDRVIALREYGWRHSRISETEGVNSRLDELQAAVLRVKLRQLDSNNAARSKIAHAYTEALKDTPFIVPRVPGGKAHAWHQYVIRTEKRDQIQNCLRRDGIDTAIHYAMPVHLQPAYETCARVRSSLDCSERICSEILSLPMYPQLSLPEVEFVCSRLIANASLLHIF